MHFGAVHGAIAAKLPPPILPRQPGSALALLTVCRLALSSAHPAAAYKRGRAPLGYRIPAQATVRQVMPDAGQVHCQPVAAEVLASTSEPAPDDCGSIIVDHFSDEQMWIFGFGSLIHNQGMRSRLHFCPCEPLVLLLALSTHAYATCFLLCYTARRGMCWRPHSYTESIDV